VGFEEMLNFIDRAVLPYVEVVSIGLNEYLKAGKLVVEHVLQPSSSVHAATVENYGLRVIVAEDEDFDRVGLKRLWPKLDAPALISYEFRSPSTYVDDGLMLKGWRGRAALM